MFTALAVGAWMVYEGLATSVEAEKTHHATILAVGVTEEFVTTSGRWPRDWEELETLQVSDRLSDRWPKGAKVVRERVVIDFEADLNTIATQPEKEFVAIKPIGPYYEYRHYVPSLQDAVRKAVARK